MKTILFAMSFLAVLVAGAQPPSVVNGSLQQKTGRIVRVSDKGRTVIRFLDRSMKKLKEIPLGGRDIRAKLGKNAPYNAATFGLKISSTVADSLDSGRKRAGRDMEVYRNLSKNAEITPNGKFVVVTESQSDFVQYADIQSDSEYPEDPVEFNRTDTVYDANGNTILQLPISEGWHPRVSNTGHFFIVTIGENAGLRILNRNKEVLAEVAFMGPVYFSDNDRYILLVDDLMTKTKASVSVYDTVNKKFELRKVVADSLDFQAIKEFRISETKREMVIQHIWDPTAAKIKVDKIPF